MKVNILKNVVFQATRFSAGETVELDDVVAERLINAKVAYCLKPAPEGDKTPEQGENPGADENGEQGENPGADENGEQGENPGADENGEQGENPGADNQDAGEDKAPADTVKPEAPEVKAEKQTKTTTKGKKAAKK